MLDDIKTYNELKSLLDIYESNPIFKQLVPNFINYIKMTIDGSINSDVNSIIEMFQNPMLDELTESLVDYLNARIQKEEC